jgi:beta-mannosidase
MSLKQSLAGTWKLRPEFIDVGPEQHAMVTSRPEGKLEIANIDPMRQKPFPLRAGYVDAPVPCDVITALMGAGIIEDPVEKDNTLHVQWLENLSWWFFRDFEVSKDLYAHEQVRLHIEMLDFKAHIIINNVVAFTHTNTFVAFDEDIKWYLKEGKNRITIRLTGGLEDNYEMPDSMSYYSVNGNHNQRTHMRKPAYTYGWDWCRAVPTCGIGRSIYLEGLSGARLTLFRADTLKLEEGQAKLGINFEIDNLSVVSSDETILKYSLLYDGKPVYEAVKDLYTMGGFNTFQEEITLKDPKLWWPNGYGDANLYTVKASVECRGAVNPMDEAIFGIRTITWDHSKRADGTRNFFCMVNGVKVYCKGGNWVPTDSVYMRTTDEKYKLIVDEAKNQHFTMLRMWGGGVYEPEVFYNQCSKDGIMLMHDFMYACAYYPDYDPAFLYEAEREAQYQTKRLANQPCIAIWTGNNEIHESYSNWFTPETDPPYYFGYKIFNYIQPKAVHDHTPLTAYMPSSPFGGKKANDPYAGDCHAWALMRELSNPEKKVLSMEEAFKQKPNLYIFDELAKHVRFSSEYGFHGPLVRSSVERYHAGEPVSKDSKSWANHEGFPGAPTFFRKDLTISEGASFNLVPVEMMEDVDGYLLYGGINHGIQYREMMEALRRADQWSGGLIWMYNDAWPETGWTTVDYYGTRKIAFYFLKRAFSPKKIILRVFDGKGSLIAINESPKALSVNLEYGYMSFDGKKSGVKTEKLELGKHSRKEFPAFEAQGNLDTGFYYAIVSGDPDFEPATSLRGHYRSYSFAPFKAAIVSGKQEGKDYLVTLKAETYVPVVQLICEDDRTQLSDNFFELIPGVEKTVRICNSGKAPGVKLVEIVKK